MSDVRLPDRIGRHVQRKVVGIDGAIPVRERRKAVSVGDDETALRQLFELGGIESLGRRLDTIHASGRRRIVAERAREGRGVTCADLIGGEALGFVQLLANQPRCFLVVGRRCYVDVGGPPYDDIGRWGARVARLTRSRQSASRRGLGTRAGRKARTWHSARWHSRSTAPPCLAPPKRRNQVNIGSWIPLAGPNEASR